MPHRNASRSFYGVCEKCFKEQWKYPPPGQLKRCYCPHHQALAFEAPEGISVRTHVTIEEYNQIIARSTTNPSPVAPQQHKLRR